MKEKFASLVAKLKVKKGAKRIEEFVESDDEKWRLKSKSLPEKSGVYAFWWVSGRNEFIKGMNREITVSGPGQKLIKLKIDNHLINANGSDSICLYIGKTAGSIQSRIGKHLRLSSKRDHIKGKSIFGQKHRTTSGQLKRGMEELFLNKTDIRDMICKNVALTYVELDGEQNCLNRFYLENLAIGTYLPIINLDVER